MNLFVSEKVHVLGDDGSARTYESYVTRVKDEDGEVFIVGAMFLTEMNVDLFDDCEGDPKQRQYTTTMDDLMSMTIV